MAERLNKRKGATMTGQTKKIKVEAGDTMYVAQICHAYDGEVDFLAVSDAFGTERESCEDALVKIQKLRNPFGYLKKSKVIEMNKLVGKLIDRYREKLNERSLREIIEIGSGGGGGDLYICKVLKIQCRIADKKT
jgi:hypothetical protein